MAHGGKREGAGRKKIVAQAGVLNKGLAAKLQAQAAIEQKWNKLLDHDDPWILMAALKYVWDRAEGKPVQPMIQDISPLEHLAERIEAARARVKGSK